MDENNNYNSDDTENELEATVEEVSVEPHEDGEYHFVRPEGNLYEDAKFVPCSEEPDVPDYYVPSEKKPKEKKNRCERKQKWLRIACLCLVCALLGGIAGGIIAYNVIDNNSAAAPVESEKPIVGKLDGTQSGSDAKLANSIYMLGCDQAVGITTEVTTTNWFGQTSSSAVSGSGFIVTDDGYIVTNYHVIEYAYNYNYKVSVMIHDGTVFDATIVGVEPSNDIAVLKIDAEDLSPVNVGDSESIQVGEEVYAIGNPLGELAFTMTTGHVSALDRSIAADDRTTTINMFQIDAAVNSGNSGGPLYNSNGEVIGVVTAKYSSTGVEGLGFAIPINDAIDIANDLITKGYVTGKAHLGANIDNRYTSMYAEYYGMPEGAYVFNVESGSSAEKAGLSAGDIITKLGDNDIKNFSDLESALREYKAGDSTELVVYRNNDYTTLNVTFDEAKPTTDSNNNSNSKNNSAPSNPGQYGA